MEENKELETVTESQKNAGKGLFLSGIIVGFAATLLVVGGIFIAFQIHRIVTENYEACVAMLKEHIDQLHLLAKYLIAHEKIDGADFEKLMKGEITAETVEKDYEEYMKSVITPEDKAEVSEEKSDAPAETTAEADSDAKADENASTEETPDSSDENKE